MKSKLINKYEISYEIISKQNRRENTHEQGIGRNVNL